MKSNFLVFLLLITLLIILYCVFSNTSLFSFENYNSTLLNEGFVSFSQTNGKDRDLLSSVNIPYYGSNTSVIMLYDTIYFDTLNGNLIEVDAYGVSGNSSTSANTVSTPIKTDMEVVKEDISKLSTTLNDLFKFIKDTINIPPPSSGTIRPTYGNTQPSLGIIPTSSSGTTPPPSSGTTGTTPLPPSSGTTSATYGNTQPSSGTTPISYDYTSQTSEYTTLITESFETSSNINGIYVLTRDSNGSNTSEEYKSVSSSGVQESKIVTIKNMLSSWTYKTKTAPSYYILYFAVLQNTYIHIINNSPNNILNLCTFYLSSNGKNNTSKKYSSGNTVVMGTTKDNDVNNNTFVNEVLYDMSKLVYKITHSVLYDNNSGLLIIKNSGDKDFKQYDSLGNIYTSGSSSKNNVSNPQILYSSCIQCQEGFVLFCQYQSSTLIAIINVQSSQFKILNIAAFDGTSLIINPNGTGDSTGPMSDYYKWLAYWTVLNNNAKNGNDDIILKTQIVPTISLNDYHDNVFENAGRGISNLVGDVADVAGDAVKGTADLVGDAVKGSADLVGDAVKGTVDLTGKAVKGTVNLAGDVAEDVVDVAEDIVSGVANIGSSSLYYSPAQVGGTNVYSSNFGVAQVNGGAPINGVAGSGVAPINGVASAGTAGACRGNVASIPYTPGNDMYSYFGALPSKGSNFIPITTSFSAFGK